MGHLIFIVLHLLCFLFIFVGLIATIPLHLIYAITKDKKKITTHAVARSKEGMPNWKLCREVIERGFYYWQAASMDRRHVIVVQVSEYKYKKSSPGRLHVQALIPVSGSAFGDTYSFNCPIENVPSGQWFGPLPDPIKG